MARVIEVKVIFEWLGFCIWGRTLYHEDRLQKDRLNLPELTQDGNHRSCESGMTKGRSRPESPKLQGSDTFQVLLVFEFLTQDHQSGVVKFFLITNAS